MISTSLIVAVLMLLITILLGIIVYLIRHIVSCKDSLIQSLTAERDQYRDELNNLVDRKRQTGPTIAGLEDALSVIRRLQINRGIEDELLDACGNKLIQLRKGPYAYDPETPSAVRKEFK